MSRDRILASIRSALEPREREPARRRAARDRLDHPAEHLSLARTRLPSADLITLFKAHIAALGADLIDVAASAEILGAIAGYLKACQQPLRLRAGSDPFLSGLPWDLAGELAVDHGPARAGDSAGLSRAVAGVAETGTLVLASGPHNPVTLAFVPDTHLVVVRGETIVPGYEQAAEFVRAELGGAGLPRTLNLVTGASRTGDIGGKIVMGAHGPRRLAVILVADA